MSPSSRGIFPGLFLALLAALSVLAVNNHWLFPALDETGVRYLIAAPALAAGVEASTPWSEWDAPVRTPVLEGEGPLMPVAMGILVRQGARAHVAGLWILAASLALTVLAVAWAAGGAGGIPGAVAGGALVLAAPLTWDVAIALRPDALLAALTALLLGSLAYGPGQHPFMASWPRQPGWPIRRGWGRWRRPRSGPWPAET